MLFLKIEKYSFATVVQKIEKKKQLLYAILHIGVVFALRGWRHGERSSRKER